MYMYTCINIQVAVPYRNRKLFCHVRRSHHCVQRAQTHCVNAATTDATKRRVPVRALAALNGSSEIRHFEHSDAIETHDGIISTYMYM